MEYHPEDIEALLYLASSLYEMKEITESLKVYTNALSMNENHTSALVNAAVILNNLGDYDKAVELSKKAMILDSSMTEVLFLNIYQMSIKYSNITHTIL